MWVGACVIGNPSFNGEGAGASGTAGGSTSVSGGSSTIADPTGTGSVGETGMSGTTGTASVTGTMGATTTTTGATTTTTTGTGMSSGDGTQGSSTGVEEGEAFCPPPATGVAEVLADNKCDEVLYEGERFYVCDEPTTWQQAAIACTAICGRLVIAKEPAKQERLFQVLFARLTQEQMVAERLGDQLSLPDASAWVGACRSGATFFWLDESVMPSTPGMDGWGPNDPDGDDGFCVAIGIYAKGEDNGSWFDRAEAPYIFVCEDAG